MKEAQQNASGAVIDETIIQEEKDTADTENVNPDEPELHKSDSQGSDISSTNQSPKADVVEPVIEEVKNEEPAEVDF